MSGASGGPADDGRHHHLSELKRLGERPDIRLIATDFDGTLVDDSKQIHDALWPLVDELHRRDITFCPASGRQYYNLLEHFEAVADELVFIAENGSYVVARGREVFSECLPLPAARQILARARLLPDAFPVLCGKRSAYVERRDPAVFARARPFHARLEAVDDLRAIEDDVLKVAIYDFLSAETNTAPRLADLAAAHQVVVSGGHWVDVMSRNASKGRALRHVQAVLGVTPDQTMAFGDFLNDLELLDAAAYSFAMANAHPLVKERARWIAPTNNANGVVRTIRAVLGLE
ncbi:MAG TPA: Cof-type HAD-IIB family hydrolase [Vicinamibacteria bacterium]|nr:Cof-type HAD-IIB family hydrolase [Vicinamibacteria bacterium]